CASAPRSVAARSTSRARRTTAPRSLFGSRSICSSAIRSPVTDRHPPPIRRMLPSVSREPPRQRPRVLAAPSPHDLHDRVDEPSVQQHVPDRQHVREGRWDGDHVPQLPQHIVLGHEVMLRRRRLHQRVRVSACAFDRLGLDGHPSVHQDHCQVQQEPDPHHRRAGDPPVREEEHHEERVGQREHDGTGHRRRDRADREGRDQLEREPADREPPSVDPQVLEATQPAAEDVADHYGEDDQGGDQRHPPILPAGPARRTRLGTLARVSEDLGYFGPDSVSWQVHKEVTVLFGGARALLMQAAHPLVIAGAGQTGMFERNPWKRLQRTLILTYTLTFGTKAEADAAAAKINDVHARINGIDPVTGLHYDALDPHLLLYVHACLVDSALLFEERTVGALDDAGRQRFHEEQMLAAELCLVPRDMIPPTVPALRAWLADVQDHGELLVTDNARRVAQLFLDPPREAEWRPVLAGVSRLAFATLPPLVREMYGFHLNALRSAAVDATFAATRVARPFLPPKYRYLAPYD